MDFLNQISVWLSFHISIIFLAGIPFTLLCWAIRKKNQPIKKLLTNYWKISLLFFISLILLIGKFSFALLIANIAILLMTISVWFWSDINDELREYDFSQTLATTTKVWRWSITFIFVNFVIQSFYNVSCLTYINSPECEIWLEPSKNLYFIIKNLFQFFLGASFTEPVAKFLGLFSLLLYILGLIQWLIIKLPKKGRNSGFSE